MKLKCQLKETHQELEETRIELDKKSQASIGFQEEVQLLLGRSVFWERRGSVVECLT